ncbi:hypothetical protein UPYG_G00038950 [Umbra pygmaea]|uniref:Uncharacterized protein n=1 Tax=Umbra pygmaea TaxID=75934 RepID=A0ABD0XPM3_UMBPY
MTLSTPPRGQAPPAGEPPALIQAYSITARKASRGAMAAGDLSLVSLHSLSQRVPFQGVKSVHVTSLQA